MSRRRSFPSGKLVSKVVHKFLPVRENGRCEIKAVIKRVSGYIKTISIDRRMRFKIARNPSVHLVFQLHEGRVSCELLKFGPDVLADKVLSPFTKIGLDEIIDKHIVPVKVQDINRKLKGVKLIKRQFGEFAVFVDRELVHTTI
jgi:hypothetical protein